MEPLVQPAQKEMLDCRQTKYAVYISENQAQHGGYLKYYYDDTSSYALIDIEPGIKSGTEKTITREYINDSGNHTRDIRHIKVIVGDGMPAENPYRSMPRQTVRSSVKPKAKSNIPGILIIFVCVIAAYLVFYMGILRSGSPSTTQTESTQAPTVAAENSSPGAKPDTAEQETKPAAQVNDDAASVIPHFEDRFYLKNLDANLQKDAVALYKGIQAFKTSIDLPRQISEEEADLLVNVIQYDCPELFQVDYSGQFMITTINGRVKSISLNYLMDKGEYEESLKACQKIIHTLDSSTVNLGNESKEKRAYDYLTDNVTYNTTKKHCGNAYGALVNKAAKCDGISLAMKWIMEELGIPTIVLAGQEKGDPYGHAWNCLYFNGRYYDLDITNDVRSSDRSMKLYGAYNVPRKWMTDIYPLSDFIKENFFVPTIATMDYSYYAKQGTLVYTGGNIRAKFFDALDEADWHSGIGSIQFESEADYQKFMKNYEAYLEDWFNENGYGGSFQSSSLNEFRTVGFELDIEY